MKNYACFVISTGRCATQWLTQHLTHLFNQRALVNTVVNHEPIYNQYAPIKNSPSMPFTVNEDIIKQHLNDIQQIVARGQNYIETGFPCWRHIAWFAKELKVPVKVIHLTRHPVFTAISLLKLNAFVPPFLPHLQMKELFSPFAPEAKLTQYQQNWQQLSPFEKNLYYWVEVQLQALDYQKNWQEKYWLKISYENLFTSETTDKLSWFLELIDNRGQCTDTKLNVQEDIVDSYGGIPQAPFDVEEIFQHPEIIKLAKSLDYHDLISQQP